MRISINLTWQTKRNGLERKKKPKKTTIRNENNNGKLKFVYFSFWLNGLIKLSSEEKFVMLCATVLISSELSYFNSVCVCFNGTKRNFQIGNENNYKQHFP